MSETTPAEELRAAAKRLGGGAVLGAHRRTMITITPECAKAVADWLDRFGDELYCYGPREFDHALAIARAYLGTDTAAAAGEQR